MLSATINDVKKIIAQFPQGKQTKIKIDSWSGGWKVKNNVITELKSADYFLEDLSCNNYVKNKCQTKSLRFFADINCGSELVFQEFSSGHRSVIQISQINDGKIIPVFREECPKRKLCSLSKLYLDYYAKAEVTLMPQFSLAQLQSLKEGN